MLSCISWFDSLLRVFRGWRRGAGTGSHSSTEAGAATKTERPADPEESTVERPSGLDHRIARGAARAGEPGAPVGER